FTLDLKNDPEAVHLYSRAEKLLDSLWDRLGSDDLKMFFLADRENVYTRLVKSTAGESPAAAFHFSEKARSRVLRESLLDPEAESALERVAPRLSGNETLVEYFISGDDIFIFVVNRSELSIEHRRGIVPAVKTICENLERHMASCSVKWEHLAQARRHLEATVRSHLQTLYIELIAPVEHKLGETIVFAPHGFLHSVPLHAMHDGAQYVAERRKAVYTPSASLYCSPAPSRHFGAPLLVAFVTSPDSSGIREIEEAALHLDNPVTLINPSIAELQDELSNPRSLVHIAGHAGVDTVSGKLSWIETSEGRLTSRDLIDMRISAKTVVVTGCQTARRMIQPGDEWLGLMRSFYMSGASTIISAFWDIRDESAPLFAREFYKTFNGNNAPVAVQQAASVLREWRSHPYFWAGFGVFVRKERSGEEL
ncbi:MAG TPA: CHAT domain-containing protein, partial [Terriglobia bacterium]|nr:CHAT domain-containing protein [Terriglobia bacterium]